VAVLREIGIGDSTILVEAADVESIKDQSGAIIHPAGVSDVIVRKLEDFLDVIRPFSKLFVERIQIDERYRPDSAEAEFTLGVSAEGNIFFAKISTEGIVKVRLKWNNLD
jgi:hypothetical protein